MSTDTNISAVSASASAPFDVTPFLGSWGIASVPKVVKVKVADSSTKDGFVQKRPTLGNLEVSLPYPVQIEGQAVVLLPRAERPSEDTEDTSPLAWTYSDARLSAMLGALRDSLTSAALSGKVTGSDAVYPSIEDAIEAVGYQVPANLPSDWTDLGKSGTRLSAAKVREALVLAYHAFLAEQPKDAYRSAFFRALESFLDGIKGVPTTQGMATFFANPKRPGADDSKVAKLRAWIDANLPAFTAHFGEDPASYAAVNLVQEGYSLYQFQASQQYAIDDSEV